MQHAPTEEQAAVQAAAKNLMTAQRGLIKTIAGAGCGKTTTLVGAARICREAGAGRQLYLAFNKALVEDGNRAFKGVADVKTFNALAFEHTAAGSKGRKITPIYPRHVVDAFDLKNRKLPMEPFAFAKSVLTTLSNFCNSGDMAVAAGHVPGWVRTEFGELVGQYATVLFNALHVDNPTTLPLPHELYVKAWHLGGCAGLFKYDLTLLDEAQDASGVMLACLAFAQRAIYVGDSCQQIYGWRNAQDAMLKLPGKAFPLSTSFRFGPQIADLANNVLKMKSTPPTLTLQGLASRGTAIGNVDRQRPHTRIFRTNAALVRDALVLADCSTPFCIVGDMGELKDKFESAYAIFKGNLREVKHPAFSQFKSWEQLEDWVEEHGDSEIRQVANLVKEYSRRPSDVIKLMSGKGQSGNAIATLTTAHKSKGREWDNVILAADFDDRQMQYARKRMTVNQRDEEINLLYVALTRTRFLLESESEFLKGFL